MKLCESSNRIGFIGGVSILVSSMIGPGLITTPTGALLLCEAIGSLPGNERFTKRIEYSKLCSLLITNRFGRVLTQIIIYAAIETFIITSIILSAQLFDNLLIDFLKISCGIAIYPEFGWICIGTFGNINGPFENRLMLFTIGFMLTILIATPMVWMELSSNTKIQIERIPIVGQGQDPIIKAVLYNYAFVITVPSLVNEMKKDVSIRKVVWTSVFITTLCYISLGIIGAMSLRMELTTNLITSIRKSELHNTFVDIISYLFPIALLAGIPVYAIVIRYNLIRSGICKDKKSQIAKQLDLHFNIPSGLDKIPDKSIVEKLHDPKLYRMSADAIPLSDIPDDFTVNSDFINNARLTLPPITTMDPDLFSILLPSQPSTPQHPSTPRSVSTDDDEFYGLFPAPKPFKAFFPNIELEKNDVNEEGSMTEKNDFCSIWIAWTAGLISCLLIGFAIIYSFVDLSFGIKTSTLL
ncbi:2960_t:CDS:2 [Cetraspora pellucida]|uniref:2960_t:CDS:1 n=1 Tax=Cetraspora pellucida TaxID=1433469 RepID=A0A9N8VQ35_9GLOM|nr:2960_t:CDS:2 [Cetraspora pellucida]